MSSNFESASALNACLRERYAQVLDLRLLRELAGQRNLSGLFVPAASDSYLRSKVRVMIVGRETAGWGRLRTDLASPAHACIDAYLARQMNFHQEKVMRVGARSKFFQFYRATSRKVAALEDRETGNAPVWANLFCFDEGRTRPDRHGHATTEAIVRLSRDLLQIQIDVLQPEWIVFATGSSCDRYLRAHFPDRIGSTVHIPKVIWEFKLPLPTGDGRQAVAFRTPHPRHAASSNARTAVIDESLQPGAIAAHLRVHLRALSQAEAAHD